MAAQTRPKSGFVVKADKIQALRGGGGYKVPLLNKKILESGIC